MQDGGNYSRTHNSRIDTIREIRARWGAPLVNYFGPRISGPAPLWRALDHPPVIEGDRSLLTSIDIPDSDPVILYIEEPYPGLINDVSFAEARAQLSGMPEYGFRSSHYVLSPDLSWIVAHTDEDIRTGHLLIIKGAVPLRIGHTGMAREVGTTTRRESDNGGAW
jgi:hypothetical protein